MYRNGHLGAALLAYAPLGTLTLAMGFETVALGGGFVAAALAMVPDYDQRVPGIAHRGPTHTVWFAAAVGIVLALVGGAVGRGAGLVSLVALAAFGFAVGFLTICSHIVADALTPMGVRPLAPYRTKKYTLDVTKAKNPIANYVLLALGIVAAAIGFGIANAV